MADRYSFKTTICTWVLCSSPLVGTFCCHITNTSLALGAQDVEQIVGGGSIPSQSSIFADILLSNFKHAHTATF